MAEETDNLPLALQPPDRNIRIRSVTSQDADALRADCWAHRTVTRSRDLIRIIKDAEKFKRGLGVVVLNADDEPAIIGYGQIMRWTQCAEISDLVVAAPYRSKGLGTALIQYLIHNISLDGIDCIEIGVAQSNPRAAALYRRLGFTYYSTLEIQVSSEQQESVDYLRIRLDKQGKR
jgi:ribosomal protein S18 acetylase RimI-like enzyme